MIEPLPAAHPTKSRPIVMRDLVRRVAGDSALYGLANFGIRALNFLLLPLYTRFLTPTDYGLITLAETFAAFLALVIGLGFDSALQRLYFHYVDDPSALASYLGSTIKFALMASAFAVLLTTTAGTPILHAFAPRFDVPYRFLIWAIVTAAAAQFLQYKLLVFQSEGKPQRYISLSVASFVLTASFAVALVVFAHRGASGMLVGKLTASLIGLCLTLVLFSGALRAPFHWNYVRETLAIGVPLVPHQLMAGGLMVADRFILGYYRNLSEVGVYSIAYTLGGVMSLVTLSLSQAWAPTYYDLARKEEAGRRAMGRICSELAVVLSAVACFGALIARDFIAHFLDHRYMAAGRIVPWIIGAYFAHSIFSMFSLAVVQARRTQWLMPVSFVAFVVNTAMNFALIPRWGMYGAAYATIVAYVVEALVMYFVAQRLYPLKYDLRRIFASVGVFLIALITTQVNWSDGHRLLALAVVGLLCLSLLAALGLKHAISLMQTRRAV
ncbi:MAG TPA: oligosaccharide flippase family protein [Terriglobales bacterium]